MKVCLFYDDSNIANDTGDPCREFLAEIECPAKSNVATVGRSL